MRAPKQTLGPLELACQGAKEDKPRGLAKRRVERVGHGKHWELKHAEQPPASPCRGRGRQAGQ